uniref:AAA family ATPase n=1 Tax=Agreia sp. TaxID=1872416 RepID=UPI0035BC1B24
REMHVIVGQGQLDAVLHATPEGRRGFIEEAAGILKHRRRKEKTQRKLEAMQANLTRLSDLGGEIRRQLKPLGRQAEIAKEAQSIAMIVRDARARLLADEVVTLRSALSDHGRTENERRTERIVLQERLEQNQLRVARIEGAQVGDAVDIARRTSFGLESVQERLRGLFTLANQRLALLGSDADGAAAGPTVTPQMVADAVDEIARLRGDVAAAERGLVSAQANSVAARSSLDSVDDEIAAQSALVSKHDLEISKLQGQVDTANSRLAAVRGEVLRQTTALEAATARRGSTQAEFAILEAEAAISGTSETDLDEAYEFAQARLFEAEAEIEVLRETLHGHERERDALAARTSALTSALDTKDGTADLIAAKVPGVLGLVADSVRVDPGFEAAIAAALGTLADAVLAETADAARTAIDLAHSDELGRVEIVVAEAHAEAEADGQAEAEAHGQAEADLRGSPIASGIAGVTEAVDVIRAPAGVRGLLARTLIVDDLAAARVAWPAVARHANVTMITRSGDVLTEYVLRGGSGAKRSRIELRAERDTASVNLDETVSLIDRAKFALAEQRGIVQVAKEHSTRALAALREFDSALAAQTEKLARLKAQLDASTGEFDRLGTALAASEETAAQAERAAATVRDELETARSRPRPMLDVSQRDALYAELEGAREREIEARLQLETTRERVRAEEARRAALEKQVEADRAAAEEAARRAVIRRRQIAAATDVVESLPAVLSSVEASVAEARLEQARAEAERAEQNQELLALRRDEAALRERLQAITENVHGLELQIYEKKLHLSSVLERVGSELGLVEDVLVAEYGPDQLIPDADAAPAVAADSDDEPTGIRFDRAAQQARLSKAERTLAELGRVNPLALEEFDALEQRHKFLTEKLTDLTKTRADLLTIIDEIDLKMQVIFDEAFTDTKAAFQEVFPILFPGGTGSISLTDPSNLLTTGIEVSVKPAGKKIERLSLLSGGERSLAAVALLIAIFKARPSPFYIMDEVEAALDDANLGRLLTIFEDLRQTSQLIVITHQKRTMEIADALYGVSMRQDGVSAVVGQRVGSAQP